MADAPHVEHLSESVAIYRGDCLEILPTLPPVDHVISDPPYESHMHAAKGEQRPADGATRKIRKDGARQIPRLDFAAINEIRSDAAQLMTDCSRGWLLAFCTPEGIAPWRDAIEAAGARYKRACFWVKPDAAPQFNGQGPSFAVEPFVAAWCGSGVSRWNGGGGKNYLIEPRSAQKSESEHPTEKPLALMLRILDLFTDPGELICDPFMGSGSTGVAAIKLGRGFVGIERDPKYFDIACRRLSDALARPDLFVAAPPKEKQESLL